MTLWDWKTGAEIKTLKGHSYWVCSLTMVNADILASGSEDKTMKMRGVDEYIVHLDRHERCLFHTCNYSVFIRSQITESSK